jgi:hypothetical protein
MGALCLRWSVTNVVAVVHVSIAGVYGILDAGAELLEIQGYAVQPITR